MAQKIQVAIVGTGPAGLTAAIYAARAGLEPVIYAGSQHGGQLTTTTEVENFPGFSQGIMGPELMTTMTAQAERFGTKVVYERINRVGHVDGSLALWSDSSEIRAETVVIATGATAKTLGLPGETKLMGRGLSTCATCDGFFYRGKKVIVIGGGDSAMEEANYLAKLCSEVVLVHRRNEFRASLIMLNRAKNNPKIKFMTPYQPLELTSDASGVTGILVEGKDNGSRQEIKADGVFMAIGHTPNSDIFKPWVDVDEHGYVKVTNFCETRTPGVYCAGDIADPVFKQAITAAGMGCQAALLAQKYLEAKHAS